jgi:hypothetical protein
MGEEQLTLLPELARENAASNRRIASSVGAAARRADDLRQSPTQAGAVRRRAARGAREALRYAVGQAAHAHGLWQEALALLQEGQEGDEARASVRAVLEVFDSWQSVAGSTRELWAAVERAGATPEGLHELDAASQDIEAFRAAAEKLLAFLTRERPPVDPAALERARQVVAEGKYKDPEAVRAGLRGPEVGGRPSTSLS